MSHNEASNSESLSFNSLLRYDKQAFGRYVREQRQKQKLTIEALSKRLGISIPYLCDIENGRRSAPLSNAKIMMDFLIYLQIPKCDWERITIMALASKGYDFFYLKL